MNYTETYHLPQWKMEDRILMEDFNNAMASIEKGLTAADKAGFLADEMSRDLYRQIVQGRVHHGHGGLTDAMWVNALASLEDAGGEGHGWNGQYGVYHGSRCLPTIEGIRALNPKEESKVLSVNPDNACDHAAITFTSDGYGMIESVGIWSRVHDGSVTGHSYLFTITMTRLDTGEVVGTAGPFQSIHEHGYTYTPRLWEVNFPVELNVSYRMSYTIQPNPHFSGTSGFNLCSGMFSDITNPPFTFAVRPADSIAINNVTPPEGATGAVGIVRWQGDGTAALAVNGQTLPVTRTRDGCNALGESCKETEFRLDDVPEEPFTLTLEMEKGEEDLEVYDYGLIWQ